MNGQRRNPGPIPPRWLNCPRKSLALIGGKFLAFKTPLDSKYDDQVPAQYRFPSQMLFDSMRAYKVHKKSRSHSYFFGIIELDCHY